MNSICAGFRSTSRCGRKKSTSTPFSTTLTRVAANSARISAASSRLTAMDAVAAE